MQNASSSSSSSSSLLSNRFPHLYSLLSKEAKESLKPYEEESLFVIKEEEIEKIKKPILYNKEEIKLPSFEIPLSYFSNDKVLNIQQQQQEEEEEINEEEVCFWMEKILLGEVIDSTNKYKEEMFSTYAHVCSMESWNKIINNVLKKNNKLVLEIIKKVKNDPLLLDCLLNNACLWILSKDKLNANEKEILLLIINKSFFFQNCKGNYPTTIKQMSKLKMNAITRNVKVEIDMLIINTLCVC